MNQLMKCVVHLTLCPGDFQESCEVCKSCPSCRMRDCRNDLQNRAIELYKSQSDVATASSSYNLTARITQVLQDIGVPAHLKGYHLLRRAIVLAVPDQNYLEQITKLLYPTLAREFDTTSSRVERAMRHAVEVAWERGDLDTLQRYFGNTISTTRGKPTSSEFIARVVDILRLEIQEMQRNG